MFFQRKPKNRRFERNEVLEVKLRSEPLRAARRHAVVLAFSAAFGTLLLAYLGARGWAWLRDEVLYDNRAFALNTIEVQTDGGITADQVRQWAGVKLGENLLAVDLAQLKRDLELVPQVESASVERVLPHLLRLRVIEREPVAQVQGLQPQPNGDLVPAVFYLDASAVVLPPLGDDNRPTSPRREVLAGLPIIRGISSSDLRPGQPINLPAVRAALRLLAAFDRSPMASQVGLQSLDVASPEVVLVTTDQGAQITFGLDGPEATLRRWRMVHEAGARLGRVVASLDLSISNNCPVLWYEAGAPPRPKPKSVKPPRLHKTNV